MRAKIRMLGLMVVVALVIVSCGDDTSGSSTSTSAPGTTTTTSATSTSVPETTTTTAAPDDKTLTIAVTEPPASFDPLLSNFGRSSQFLRLAYDSLIRVAPDGSLVPGLAESWAYSEGNTVFDVTIRDGLVFADGSPLDANAVKANFDRAMTVSGPSSSQFATVASVEVVPPRTVRLHLSAATPVLITSMTQNLGMMANPAAFGTAELDAALDQNPMGAGPYTLDTANTLADDHYTFVRNPNYYAAEDFPYHTVLIRRIPEINSILNSLQAGDIDGGTSNYELADAAVAAGLQVSTIPLDTSSVILFDRTGAIVPALGDVRVRQALNYAIDRQAIVDSVVHGYGTPTSQFISPAMEGYDPALDNYYTYDPQKARDLLAEAGYADGFTLPILTPSQNVTVVQAIAGYLEDVGITVEVVLPETDYFSAFVAGGNAATWCPWGMTNTYLDMSNLLTENGFGNVEKSTDPEMIRLLTEGAGQPDAERAATYQALSRRITEQGWFLVVYIEDAVWISAPTVTNVTMTPGVVLPDIRGWQPAS
jgi:peptide/nickel transport system substrate-binding protein